MVAKKKSFEPEPKIIYPIEEMKKLPDSFWKKMPTFSNVHYYVNDRLDSNQYFEKEIGPKAFAEFKKIAHLLNPYWCTEGLYHFLGNDWNEEPNLFYALYMVGETKIRVHCPYGSTSAGREIQGWEPMTNNIGDEVPGGQWERVVYSERLMKALFKIGSVWNKCRKDAHRRLGLEKDAKTAKSEREQKVANAREKARQVALAQACETRTALNDFIEKLRHDDVTKDDIGAIYDELITLTQRNVEYREASGSTMPRSK